MRLAFTLLEMSDGRPRSTAATVVRGMALTCGDWSRTPSAVSVTGPSGNTSQRTYATCASAVERRAERTATAPPLTVKQEVRLASATGSEKVTVIFWREKPYSAETTEGGVRSAASGSTYTWMRRTSYLSPLSENVQSVTSERRLLLPRPSWVFCVGGLTVSGTAQWLKAKTVCFAATSCTCMQP